MPLAHLCHRGVPDQIVAQRPELETKVQSKIREGTGIGALGLGVATKRGEEAASTFDQEFEDDGDYKPTQTTDSPGLLQTDADIRQLRGMFGHMCNEPGPRAFGNPWYS